MPPLAGMLAASVATVLAGVLGLLTWEAVALSLSAAALAASALAIALAGKALERTDQFQAIQAARISRLEDPPAQG